MTREEAKEYLINISYQLGTIGIEYLSEKDGIKMREAIETLEQVPFMYKPCVAHQVCHNDKVKVLDKIKAEIMQVANQEKFHDEKWALGLRYAVNIIDKYKAEKEIEK